MKTSGTYLIGDRWSYLEFLRLRQARFRLWTREKKKKCWLVDNPFADKKTVYHQVRERDLRNTDENEPELADCDSDFCNYLSGLNR